MMDLLQLRGVSLYLPMRRKALLLLAHANKKGVRLCMADAPMTIVWYGSR